MTFRSYPDFQSFHDHYFRRGVKSGDLIFQPMEQKLGALTNKELLDSVKIIIQTSKNTDWARGAASLALEEIYQQD